MLIGKKVDPFETPQPMSSTAANARPNQVCVCVCGEYSHISHLVSVAAQSSSLGMGLE